MAYFANFPNSYFSSFKYGAVVFGLLSILQFCHCHYYVEEKACGALYSEANYGGQVYAINDRGQSINLLEDHHASEEGWNNTGSLKIESGCSMEVCNETYFDGTCQALEPGTYAATTALNVSNIVSVSCSCAKECKCSDIFMKRSSCARAYLEGGCRTCHALYTDLAGAQRYFPDEFVDKVEALRLRKGCTLTVYPEEDFEGEEEIIDSETVEDYEGKIRSYECDCNDAEYQPQTRGPRPSSYPPLVNIPDTLDGVLKALQNKEYSEHPGLRAALKSLKNRRSSKNAYILLLGATGAGKSSAINLLFDNPNVTKVGGEKSTTTDIHEFRIPVPVDELGVANSELRVIDTPGLGDTRGLEQDAKFLTTLDSFLTNHEELKDRIPNVVLLFHKFHDNRFNGEGSQFVKMLRGFDSFRERITDENYSNVIFVLSHFCSETKANKRRPEARLAQFKAVIQDYSLFPKPTLITVAENKAKDQELPMVNGYFKLPNNEYYPRNLFEKMELVTGNGGDMMGLGVFRTAFRDSDGFNVTSITFKLVEKGSSRVEHYLSILSNAIIGVEKTEISQILQQVWEEKVDVKLRKQFPFSLHYLQKALNIRNINVKEDIPKTSTAILQLLTAIKHDEATRTLLERALNIKPPVFQQSTVAGFSYNVFKDTYLPTSPFLLGDVQQSDIGFLIPKILTCKLEPNTKEIFYVMDNKEQYLEHRVKSLGIEGTISNETFSGAIKPGHNIKELSFKADSCSLSATREFRLFEFVLNDRLDLTPEFTTTVKSLPPFNETDHAIVEVWKQFFNDYGTHIVNSIYGGGAIQIELQSDKAFNNDLAQALFDLIKFAEEMSFMVDDESEGGNSSSSRTVLKEGIAHSLTFLGGDSAFHTNDLTRLSVEAASKLLTNWKKSLKFNPAVLNTEMRLVPISRIVKKLGQNYTAEIDRASSLLFKSELKYVKPITRADTGPGLARQETPFISQILKQQQESNQRIHEMMMEMKKLEQENERKRQEMEQKRLEWEQEKYREDQVYKQKQLQAAQMQEAERQQWLRDMEVARQEQEAKRQMQQQQYQLQLMESQAAANRRNAEIMKQMMDRPPPPTSSCLKAGTKILMDDFTERNVETLKVGDMVLDKDLKPTKVLGVSYEFILLQKLYGFSGELPFFTNSHIFVGPSMIPEQSIKLYAQSTLNLYDHNPLMEYLNITEMKSKGDEQVTLFHLENSTPSSSVVARNVSVFEDIHPHAMDTPVYFIQVDSPTGTYFANGYICHHEIPPVEYWPNTMSVLFRLMNTPAFENLSQREYSFATITLMEDITNAVASKLKEYVASQMELDKKSSDQYPLMILSDVDMEECISKIFSNPTVAAAGVSLYAKAGAIISPYLDGANESVLPNHVVASLQHKIYDLINAELDRFIV